MRSYDIAIIGAGVVGASVSRELSRYDLRIALIEKEEEVAFGVSKSNSGIIHPGTQNPPHTLKAKLCVEGNILTRRLSKELGFDFKEVGELIVAFDEEERMRLFQIKKEAEELGVPKLAVVDSAWLRENEPNLNKEAVAALYAPTAGIVSPYRMVYDLSENAAKNGAEIHTDTEVKDIACRRGFEIFTTKGVFKARYVINTAGLYADSVSRMAGVSNFQITPRKGEEFILDKKRQYLTRHLLFPLPTKISKGVLVIKTSDGNPMIGPSADDAQDKEDLSTSEEGFKKVLSSAQRLVPSIDGRDIIAYFAGLRPVAGKDFIIRHEAKAPGFINVAGIQSPGLTAAAAIAFLVTGILKENGLSLKKKSVFHKHRKKTVHLFAIPLAEAKKLIRKDKAYGDLVCRCEMVSAKEIKDAIGRGAKTLDGIKFRTRAQAGRCHGAFCTTRIIKILSEGLDKPLEQISKKGSGSEIIKEDRADD